KVRKDRGKDSPRRRRSRRAVPLRPRRRSVLSPRDQVRSRWSGRDRGFSTLPFPFRRGNRDEKEMEAWKSHDPVLTIGSELDPEEKERIDAEVEEELRDAIAFAEASPFPDPSEL